MDFKVGDRVALVNIGWVNLGTVAEEDLARGYRVAWDDGVHAEDDEDQWYFEGELLEVR